MLPFTSLPAFFYQILVIISSLLLLMCASKKKFETDARADLVPRNATPKQPVSPQKSSSQLAPTAQTPPHATPVEKSDRREEDTLANVQSLQPESSDGPMAKHKKKK